MLLLSHSYPPITRWREATGFRNWRQARRFPSKNLLNFPSFSWPASVLFVAAHLEYAAAAILGHKRLMAETARLARPHPSENHHRRRDKDKANLCTFRH
jgi:hypothetical protein